MNSQNNLGWYLKKVVAMAISNEKITSIEDRIKQVIVDKFGIAKAHITPETSFIKDWGADSLDMFELMLDMEKEFNITIPDEVAEKFRTVADIFAYIKMRVVALA